jgi:hypothetical protein
LSDQVKKTEIGRTCDTYGEEERCYRALVGKPEGRSQLKDPGVDVRIILKRIFREVGWGS